MGWIVNGPLRGVNSHDTTSGLIQVTSNRISVATLDELWNHQQFKIDFPECQNDRVEMSREDIQFLEMVSQSAKLIEGHYNIGLPLRNTVFKMPNNRKVAEQRALNLKKKFIKNPQFHAEYSAFVEDWIVKDYAVKVPNEEISHSDGKVWYLPHHGVYHAKKLKIRVVFDCGASFQGTTLNDQLLQGPDLMSTLLGVITRFRQEVVAVMADVEAMFHQVQEEAVSMYSDLRAILHSGGFRLTKWVSNSRAVLSAIPVEERAEELRDLNLDLDMLPVERALGVQWCIESDNFKFRIIIQERPPTRRGILSVVGSIYDPLGILAPVVLTAKLILQELCRLKLGWDDDIPEHLAKKWNSWLEDLHLLKDFGVSRCFKPRDFGKVIFKQLHHFADASQEGYGTVSYLLQENEENKLHVAFVMAKARVAPLKPLTIPRMELATTVLKYIGNRTSRFRTFVANRVEMILKLSEVRQWRHVNTAKNPADIASRGLDVRSFLRNESWIKGPDFLTKPEEEWPQNPDNHGDLTTEDPEVRKAMVNTTAVEEQLDTVQRFLEYYSSWNRLKKAVSWMLKLRNTLLTLCRKREEMNASLPQSEVQKKMKIFKESLPKTNLTVENLKEAELKIIRFCQQRKYSEEISVLRKGEDVKMSSHIYKLKPKLQEGILRVGGRLSRSAMPEEVKHPAILPKDFHQMADLPQDRVLPDEPPFTYTGVDYFGPFEVKRGRRRGQVKTLRSDNGTNFVGAEKALKRAMEEWNVSKIESSLRQRGIQWIFNPPTGSHHGGVWERMIRLVRKILSSTVRLQTLDEEGLHTVLCEAEAIINSQPITKASNDPSDLEALTPNHLLLLQSKPSLPPGLFMKEDVYARRRWKQVQYIADIFWKRWTREYLLQLQERQKWTRASRNFAEGDIVLIVDDSAPRNSWVLGKIIEVVPDAHGLVRRVRIKTKTTTLDRPITKVCLLQKAV
ncbi:hypothetical protein PO909_021172 [Leuciscus waleckii]